MIHIKVLQEDIDNALADRSHCPIDFSISRIFDKPIKGVARYGYIKFDGTTYYTPEKAKKFMVQFDKKVKPIEFNMVTTSEFNSRKIRIIDGDYSIIP